MTKYISNYLRGRIKSFKYAFNGFSILFKEEKNAQIHTALAIIALLLGYFLNISSSEWVAISIVIGFVFAMEAINSSIERLADFVCKKETNWHIKKIKDLSAAAVLLSAVAALIVGLLIFLPKIFRL